jgi:tryptophan synthase alpha chain
MDGPVIQEATGAALAAGFRLRDTFTAVRAIAERTDVPILVMTYWNPVVQYGVDRYADDLAAGGAGLITPDITPDAAADWIAASERTGLDRVFLAAPTSTDERLDLIVRSSTGFVYTVSTMGITGERGRGAALVARLRDHGAACVRRHRHLTPDQVAGVMEYADGAIVGTALVRALRDGGIDGLSAGRALSHPAPAAGGAGQARRRNDFSCFPPPPSPRRFEPLDQLVPDRPADDPLLRPLHPRGDRRRCDHDQSPPDQKRGAEPWVVIDICLIASPSRSSAPASSTSSPTGASTSATVRTSGRSSHLGGYRDLRCPHRRRDRRLARLQVDRHPVLDFRGRPCAGLLARAEALGRFGNWFNQRLRSPHRPPLGRRDRLPNGVAAGFPRHPLHPRSSTSDLEHARRHLPLWAGKRFTLQWGRLFALPRLVQRGPRRLGEHPHRPSEVLRSAHQRLGGDLRRRDRNRDLLRAEAPPPGLEPSPYMPGARRQPQRECTIAEHR